MIDNLVVFSDDSTNEITRSVTMTNEQWGILALCADAYATTFRSRESEFIATYVTRGQLDEAVSQASRMNQMLQTLDQIQAKLL